MQIKAVGDKIVLTGIKSCEGSVDNEEIELILDEAMRFVGSNPVGVNKNVLCISHDFTLAIAQVKENTRAARLVEIQKLKDQVKKLEAMDQ